MSNSETTRISKFLSLVLRHQPDSAGIQLDEAGWVGVDALLAGMAKAGHAISLTELAHVVESNSKKRFEYSGDGMRIRASQGHSIDVDLQYEPSEPPELLYHGTATRYLDSIREQGLLKMQRHHVHLTASADIALETGRRHGQAVLLTVQAGRMHREGHVFFRSTNGVWLVDRVPAEFLA